MPLASLARIKHDVGQTRRQWRQWRRQPEAACLGRLRRIQTGMGSGTRSITTKAAPMGSRRAKRERGTSWRPAPEPKASGPDQPVIEHLLVDPHHLVPITQKRPPSAPANEKATNGLEPGSAMGGSHHDEGCADGAAERSESGHVMAPRHPSRRRAARTDKSANTLVDRHRLPRPHYTGGRTPSAPASGRRHRLTGCGPRSQGGSVLALPDTSCRDLDISPKTIRPKPWTLPSKRSTRPRV